MPQEYDAALVEGYARMHAHFGELLEIYSLPLCCALMETLEENKELTVGEFRQKIGKVKPYVLSRHLTLLFEKKHILKSGKIYSLNNDLFYSSLKAATRRSLQLIRKSKNEEPTPEDISMTATLFLSMIYDKVSNILIHILLRSPRPLTEIVEVYRRNHGYVSSNVVRYHLTGKKFQAYSVDISIFGSKAKRYALTQQGRGLHEVYDECMNAYIEANERWMREVWSKPIKELVSDRVSMTQLGDKLYKVLRMLGKTDFVIVRSNKVEGVVTIQHAMSVIGKLLDTKNFWGSMTASEVMLPISVDDIIPGDETLRGLYKKRGEFTSLYYVVDVGGGNYNILDMNKVFKILNDT